LFGIAAELASLLLFMVVVVLVFRIGHITGSFRAWNLVSMGFLLIVIRRAISLLAPFVAVGNFLKEVVEPIVLLAISLLFIAGFYELMKIFQRSNRDN